MNHSVQGGTQANRNGVALEEFIRQRLNRQGYTAVSKEQFALLRSLERPIYAQQFCIAQSIYNTRLSCDFIIHHRKKWPNGLAIESKWQQSGGSVDEKFPFLVLNIKRYPCPTVILLDGDGYRENAKQWLKSQTDQDKLLYVFSMPEFQKWVNQGNI